MPIEVKKMKRNRRLDLFSRQKALSAALIAADFRR